jgi:flagellar biosynthesis/type III secretory pathway M-ring protein FliF/YscJ
MTENMLDSLLVFLGLMVTVTTIGRIIVKVIDARAKRNQPALPSELEGRIARIEQIVEATAIEVERVSEGQRFTVKVLSERQGALLPEKTGKP